MRLERLNGDKFKVFLTFDDMKERGITKEDLWQDLPKVHDLFRDMMLEADDELGFKIDGPIAVEVYAMPAQGMVIIVTKGVSDDYFDLDDIEEGYIEMQVTLDESDEIFYEFSDIEDVIALSSRLYSLGVIGGTLFSFEGCYYLRFDELDIEGVEEEGFVALLSEFGSPSTVSTYRVIEYGKEILVSEAVLRLYMTFFRE
ncbi:genetic competence negative regulator [Halalkalibacter nanhaiisediminis]|uniref:Adapter protein MecA n=1 Tax=Halalkalibacter nanhaiisediminis TaxID=688079 RepID=A0A562QD21_9BACI|nr:genetic competence negative regulator [Halalkalibacter nanhaiisediminis]TWI54603.1 adapter protein MecA 1/2 [Halalkalibacter nanhaiisediminis]